MESSYHLGDHLPLVVVDDDVVIVVVVGGGGNDVAVVLYTYISNNIKKKDWLWRLYKETTPITSNHWRHLLFFLSYYTGREHGISPRKFGPMRNESEGDSIL